MTQEEWNELQAKNPSPEAEIQYLARLGLPQVSIEDEETK